MILTTFADIYELRRASTYNDMLTNDDLLHSVASISSIA